MQISDLHTALFTHLQEVQRNQIVVIASPNTIAIVHTLVGEQYPIFMIADGEESKSMEGLQAVYAFLMHHHIAREGIILNIGGGVVSDLGGMAAATWKRGIRYINIPTTLLSQVDAALGGKSGINLMGIKNCIGVFYEPQAVLCCEDWLKTLPAEEWLSGWGEVIKYALISGKELWGKVLNYHLEDGFNENIRTIVEACQRIKAYYVQCDPRDTGERHALNFGHTVGHALEAQTGAKHGYCVLWGLVAEVYLSCVLLGCDRSILTHLTHIMVNYYGRPTCDCKDQNELIKKMHQDKKNTDEIGINCTLLRNLGKIEINHTISDEQMREALDWLMSV